MKPKKPICKVCGKPFNQYNSIQNKCIPCAIELGKKEKPVKVNIPKVAKKIKAELRDKLETYPKRLQKAKKVFQAWVRNRDKDNGCISCGNTKALKYDGGHYLKAELYSGVIFDERNVSKQCVSCNKYQDGNVAAYRINLVAKIGLKQVEELETLAQQTRTKKYSDEELNKIKTKYKL